MSESLGGAPSSTLGMTPGGMTLNPMQSGMYQKLSQLPPEKLQEAAMKMGSSPIGRMAAQVLQQKRMMPNVGAQPQQQVGAPAAPPQPQVLARGGTPHLDIGGIPMGAASPWWTRNDARESTQEPAGFLHSSIAGRTDHIPASPGVDSYVIPADVVSGLGEGNSLAGARAISLALSTGPYGTEMPRAGGRDNTPRPPRVSDHPVFAGAWGHSGFARGGSPAGHVDCLLAGGEYLVPPQVVRAIGKGDIERGQGALDHLVLRAREHTIKTLQKLPAPVGAKRQ